MKQRIRGDVNESEGVIDPSRQGIVIEKVNEALAFFMAFLKQASYGQRGIALLPVAFFGANPDEHRALGGVGGGGSEGDETPAFINPNHPGSAFIVRQKTVDRLFFVFGEGDEFLNRAF